MRTRRTPKVTRKDSPTASKARAARETESERLSINGESSVTLAELRDGFAACALMGGFSDYLTARDDDGVPVWMDYNDFASSCYNAAEAMLRERAKRGLVK